MAATPVARVPLVLVVDDDDLVRESICMLAQSHGYRTRGFAGCADFLADPARTDCDCLILDVRLPGISGPQLQEHLRTGAEHCPIIFISGHGTVPLAVQAMRLGALDFLQKPFDEALLLDRVAQAVAQSAVAREQRQTQAGAADLLAQVSVREREVLELLVQGLMSKQIADRLGISTRTVEQHRATLRRKLRARTGPELLRIGAMLLDNSN